MSDHMASGHVPSSFELQNASATTNHRSSAAIPGGGADSLSVNVDEHFKSANVSDFGFKGDLSSVFPIEGGATNENVFGFIDRMGDTLAPMKFSTQPALAPVTSEFTNANLSHVSIGEQTKSGLTGNTAIISGQQQGH
ncbi:MAG: hypothetical protein SFV53_02805 [Rickettsiales bacterium]|nr:hypothetical protein [Rickettsiales bacterium]